MKNYVISVVNASKRREHIKSEFFKQNIYFEFFDAVTPINIMNIKKNLNISLETKNLTDGELGCLLSHLCLWKKLIDEEIEYLTVFEDDIHLGQDASYFLNYSDWLPLDFDLIKLEKFAPNIFSSILPKHTLNFDRKLYGLKAMHLGTAGYIISRQGAKKLFDKIHSMKKLLPIDHIMFDEFIENDSINVYQMIPALCIQDDILHKNESVLPSDLQTDRKILRNLSDSNKVVVKKEDERLYHKMIREVLRVFFQIIHLNKTLSKKKLKFK